MNNQVSLLFKSKDLKWRLLFVLCALIIYRFGCYVTLPGIDSNYIADLFQNSLAAGFLGMFNLFSGGALGRMTIFALNIMPYIVSSIILQISVSALKNEGKLSEDIEAKKLSFYSKLLTMVLAFVQGFIIVIGLEKIGAFPKSGEQIDLLLRFLSVITLVGGTMFLVWLGDQITNHGIGNGISLIIFSGIIAEMPASFSNIFLMGRLGDGGFLKIIITLLLIFLTLILVIFCERSYRYINVSYPRRQIRNRIYNDSTSHIPVKLNMAGVIPPIFANALLLFPLTIANFNKESAVGEFILRNFSVGQPLYLGFYAIMIVFFCFFYSDFVFNTKEIAESLKKNGGIIIGKRPGRVTKEYLDYIIKRLTIIGAIYLSFVCVVPELLRAYYYIPFAIGGTSLLILVNVIIELFMQVQTYLFSSQYSNLLEKNRFSTGK